MRRSIAVGLVSVWLLLPAARSSAQGTLTTLFTNGPTARRINIVVLSEGYQTNQLGQFLVDASNAVANLMGAPPYQEYANYFNAYAISVASVQSGSDHPEFSPPTYVNTYFNSTFDSYAIPRLLTIPPNDLDANYNDGQGKVDSLLQSLMPEYDLVVIVVNDLAYGGSGGQTLISSLNASSPEIVVHESGHTLGGLADEYSTAFPGYVPVEKPNATQQTNRAAIKWTAWILADTPLPTPNNFTYANLVGLFQGAEYQTTGWYRPKYDCKMNHLGVPFCEICSEQLVKSFYRLVRPIDSFSPTSTNFSILSTQAVSFSVAPLQPTTHNLSVQWYTNNAAITGSTNTTFQLLPTVMSNGMHTVRAVVFDPTALVRNDPTNLLRATNTWFVTVSINQLSLKDALFLTNGSFRLTVSGLAPQGFVIQASTNLMNWTSLATNNLAGGLFFYTNSGPAGFPRRFYRAYAPP